MIKDILQNSNNEKGKNVNLYNIIVFEEKLLCLYPPGIF